MIARICQKTGLSVFSALLLSVASVSSCKPKVESEVFQASSPGETVVYAVNKKLIASQNANFKELPGEIYFTWLPSGRREAAIHHVLISDGEFEFSTAPVIVYLDKKNKVVDQARNTDGSPFEINLSNSQTTPESVRKFAEVKLAQLILQQATRALSNSPDDPSKVVTFEYEGNSLSQEKSDFIMEGYGPLPQKIYVGKTLLIEMVRKIGSGSR